MSRTIETWQPTEQDIAHVSFGAEQASLPSGYTRAAAAGYLVMQHLVEAQIMSGRLHQNWGMPKAAVFGRRLEALHGIFSFMRDMRIAPQIIFAPDASVDALHKLLQGIQYRQSSYSDEAATQGLSRGLIEMRQVKPEPNLDPWDVVVISGVNRPPVLGTSADGQHGRWHTKAQDMVAGLRRDVKAHAAGLAPYSPSLAAYCGLQASRILTGTKPVDTTRTATLGRETIGPAGEVWPVYYSWDMFDASVQTGVIDAPNSTQLVRPGIGFRPAMMGRDVLPEA